MSSILTHWAIRPLSLFLSVFLFLAMLPLAPPVYGQLPGEEEPRFSYFTETDICNTYINVAVEPPGNTSDPLYGYIDRRGWMYIGNGQYIRDVVTTVLAGPRYWSRWSETRYSQPMPDKGRRYTFTFTQMPPGEYSGEIRVDRYYRSGTYHLCQNPLPITLTHTGSQEDPAIEDELGHEIFEETLTLQAAVAATGNPDAPDYGEIAGDWMSIGCDWMRDRVTFDVTAVSAGQTAGHWTKSQAIANSTEGPNKARLYAVHVPYTPAYDSYKVRVRVERNYYYGNGNT